MQETLRRAAAAGEENKQSGGAEVGVAVLAAGLLAGIAFLAMEALAALLTGADSPLGPAYMMLHALGAGHGAAEAHDPVVVGVGIVLHLVLSVGTIAVLGALVHRWLLAPAVAVGITYGALLFAVTFLLAGGVGLQCWDVCGLTTLFNYCVFGGLGAWLIKRLQRRDQPVA